MINLRPELRRVVVIEIDSDRLDEKELKLVSEPSGDYFLYSIDIPMESIDLQQVTQWEYDEVIFGKMIGHLAFKAKITK